MTVAPDLAGAIVVSAVFFSLAFGAIVALLLSLILRRRKRRRRRGGGSTGTLEIIRGNADALIEAARSDSNLAAQLVANPAAVMDQLRATKHAIREENRVKRRLGLPVNATQAQMLAKLGAGGGAGGGVFSNSQSAPNPSPSSSFLPDLPASREEH